MKVSQLRPHVYRAELRGSVLDKDFESTAFDRFQENDSLIIDFGNVERITSFGVREWQVALRRLRAKYVCFTKVRSAVMWQFNMIAGFACGGEILSCFAPYACQDCGNFQQLLVDIRESYDSLGEQPSLTCEVCGSGQMEFDDLEEVFFEYIASQPRPSPPSDVLAILTGTPEQPRMRPKKHVEGTVTGLWLAGPLVRAGEFRHLRQGLEGEVCMILEDLTEVSADGVRSMLALIREVGVPIWLARVPQPLWRAFEGLAGIRVVSASLSFDCHQCGIRHGHASRGALRKLTEGGLHVSCDQCGARLKLRESRHELQSAMRLSFASPPPAIIEYLRRYESQHALTKPGSDGPDSIGSYRLDQLLAEGGMGEIYLGRKVGLAGFEKPVVVKLIRQGRVSALSKRMFLQEARLAARLNHPNIVQIFDLGESRGRYYIAMEYVAGHDVRSILKSRRASKTPLAPHVACTIVADVCLALSVAHSNTEDGQLQPIIHRDISPDNILVSSAGVVKLTDFGIATTLDLPTSVGVKRGKWAYLPPEVLESGDSTSHDVKGDIFAAGLVLYELLTLKRYFGVERKALLMNPKPTDDVAPRPLDLEGQPESLVSIIAKATARDRSLRYGSARSLGSDLERVMRMELGGRASRKELAAVLEGVSAVPVGERTSVLDTNYSLEFTQDPEEVAR